ncbi:hypothetical protein GH714_018263 [Hevea brasiliensis]|uniref:CDP-diacylglycerol--serine O-phosphatidyltransferase n=1 Tax=Hevea brasiliensis TaxID=3981 RepID=A0A6A6MB68_HEVBR|nr:hypothetical protein GH714_018263 [Hevea brasiliensis]
MEPNGHRRVRRREHIVHQNGDMMSPSVGDVDPWTAWAYKPRTISLLLIGACLLIWASGALNPESSVSGDVVTSVKRGVWAMIAVFLAYCLLQALQRKVLIRPHPAIWRLVHGMAVVYLVALTFLLFQDTLFDEFVLAHIFGWWGKAILIRNQPLLWVLSIGFELMEPIVTISLVYFTGIWAGMHTVRSNEHWDNLHQHSGTKMSGTPYLVHGDLSKFLAFA